MDKMYKFVVEKRERIEQKDIQLLKVITLRVIPKATHSMFKAIIFKEVP